MLRRLRNLGLCFAILGCLVDRTVGQNLTASSELKVVVILDNSGSMNERMSGGRRIDVAKQAMLTVLDQTPAEAEVGVLLLNSVGQGRWLVPLGPVNPQAIRGQVDRLSAGGGTPLGESMKIATDSLLALREKNRYGTYKLLVVSDGEASDPQLVETYLPQIQARGVLVDVIGVSMAQQHSLATKANTYRNANDAASLATAISEVVLGESSGDATDDESGESDFELLAPLSAEIAVASLKALGERPNEPLAAGGRNEFVAQNQSARRPTSKPGNRPPADRNNQGNNKAQGEGLSVRHVFLGVIAFFVFMRLVKAVGKSS